MSVRKFAKSIDAPSMKKLTTFLGHLERTGLVAFAAERVGLSRTTLYRRKKTDPVFAAGQAGGRHAISRHDAHLSTRWCRKTTGEKPFRSTL